jgi:hypothetical protein
VDGEQADALTLLLETAVPRRGVPARSYLRRGDRRRHSRLKKNDSQAGILAR